MKKTLAIVTTIVLLAGCTTPKDPTPAPVPSISVSPSVDVSEAPKPRPTPNPPTEVPDSVEPTKPKPQPSVTTSEADTPANKFAKRWGLQFPNVQEFEILRVANDTCRIIKDAGENWEESQITRDYIADRMIEAKMFPPMTIEFGQDAEQNYCASVANPT